MAEGTRLRRAGLDLLQPDLFARLRPLAGGRGCRGLTGCRSCRPSAVAEGNRWSGHLRSAAPILSVVGPPLPLLSVSPPRRGKLPGRRSRDKPMPAAAVAPRVMNYAASRTVRPPVPLSGSRSSRPVAVRGVEPVPTKSSTEGGPRRPRGTSCLAVAWWSSAGPSMPPAPLEKPSRFPFCFTPCVPIRPRTSRRRRAAAVPEMCHPSRTSSASINQSART